MALHHIIFESLAMPMATTQRNEIGLPGTLSPVVSRGTTCGPSRTCTRTTPNDCRKNGCTSNVLSWSEKIGRFSEPSTSASSAAFSQQVRCFAASSPQIAAMSIWDNLAEDGFAADVSVHITHRGALTRACWVPVNWLGSRAPTDQLGHPG